MLESLIKKSIVGALAVYQHRMNFTFWVQDSVGIYDSAKGVYRRSNNAFSSKGVSDIIVIMSVEGIPIPIFLEVKNEKGLQSDVQKAFETKIKEHNGFYCIVRSPDDALNALANVQKIIKTKLEAFIPPVGEHINPVEKK